MRKHRTQEIERQCGADPWQLIVMFVLEICLSRLVGEPRSVGMTSPHFGSQQLRLDTSAAMVDNVTADPRANQQQRGGKAGQQPAPYRRDAAQLRQRIQAEQANGNRATAWMPLCQNMSRWVSSVWTGTVKKASRPVKAVNRPVIRLGLDP